MIPHMLCCWCQAIWEMWGGVGAEAQRQRQGLGWTQAGRTDVGGERGCGGRGDKWRRAAVGSGGRSRYFAAGAGGEREISPTAGKGRKLFTTETRASPHNSNMRRVAETPNPGAHFGGQLPFSVGRDRGKVPLCIYA